MLARIRADLAARPHPAPASDLPRRLCRSRPGEPPRPGDADRRSRPIRPADALPSRQSRQLLSGLSRATPIGPIAPTTGCTRTWAATPRSPPTACPTPAPGIPAATRDAFAAAFPPEHLAFLDACAPDAAIGGYLFVHAGIRPGVPLVDQDPRRPDLDPRAVPDLDRRLGFKVVHGHTIVPAVEHHPTGSPSIPAPSAPASSLPAARGDRGGAAHAERARRPWPVRPRLPPHGATSGCAADRATLGAARGRPPFPTLPWTPPLVVLPGVRSGLGSGHQHGVDAVVHAGCSWLSPLRAAGRVTEPVGKSFARLCTGAPARSMIEPGRRGRTLRRGRDRTAARPRRPRRPGGVRPALRPGGAENSTA